MKAKQSNLLKGSAKTGVTLGIKNGSASTLKNATTLNGKTVAHAKNGATGVASISSPVNGPVKKKAAKPEKELRAQPMSAKKLARLAKLKAYFDTLDEDTHIREFETLKRDEMHYLACVYLAEDLEKGRRLT